MSNDYKTTNRNMNKNQWQIKDAFLWLEEAHATDKCLHKLWLLVANSRQLL